MAEIFDFIVNDNRTITYKLTEPIMLEDNGVSDWRFHIPNIVNGLDATGWQWWLVYVNARNDKYTIPLTLEYDYDRPDAYSIATYTVDYGMSCKVGSVKFSIEAIDADTGGGTILHEWHTKTYSATVEDTLQGNQVEYAETESDIISALLVEVRNKVNQLVGGATPLPVNLKSLMTDHDKVYLYTGSETGESTGYWYCWNGADFVPGGLYGAGVIDSVPTQGSTNAVSSGGVYSALADKVAKPITSPNGTNGQLLRTLGNGQTEWADVGTPTDAQVGEAVDEWLNDHPEATTTVQDGAVTTAKLASGSVTEAKLSDALKLKTVNDYVTPEMYGAKGDGVADDTQALTNAFAQRNVCLTNGATYLCANVPLVSNSHIIGNGATIKSGTNSGFYISKTVHDVIIEGIVFESEFAVGDTDAASNYCIGIQAPNTTEEYEAYNIEISHCKFTCGVFGIIGTSVQNLHIHDCEFYGCVYRPDDFSGGYAIITQSCSNVTIERCFFKLGKYSRHDVYVSVSPAKTENISSRNYRISNCFSDKSLIEEHADNAFYSTTILAVSVRSVYNFILENYRLYKGTGLVNFNTSDGDVKNAIVRNCINDTPRFKSASVMQSEMRQSFGFMGAEGSDVKFEKCLTLNNSNTAFNDYSVYGGYIEVCSTILANRLDVGDCEFLHMHDLFVKGAYLRFYGTGVLRGKFHSLDSDGNYTFGSATNVSNGAYIDINAYDDKLLGPWAISSTGALTFVTGKLHIAASGAAESNDNGTIVTLNYSQRPTQITRAMSLTDGTIIEANVTTGSLGTNQVRLRKINIADGSAASSRTCRFFL